MSESLKPWKWLESHAGWLLGVGLITVGLSNWLKWQQDRALALLLRDRKPTALELSSTTRVSVLVAAWNETNNIRKFIEAFERLRYPDRELILCAGGKDNTYEIASRHASPNLIVLEQQPGEGKQRALSRGLKHATGKVIFLTDADCMLNDDCFERTIAPVIAGDEMVATGSRKPMNHQLGIPFVLYQWYYHAYCMTKAPDYADGLEGRNTAVAREALERAGGFSGVVPVGTDYHLASRLLAEGYCIRYIADSEVCTEHPASLGDYWRQQSRWLRNLVLHGVHFGDWTAVRVNLQRGLIGLVMIGLPLACFGRSKVLFSGWAALFVQAFLSRVRYARAIELRLGQASVHRLGYGQVVTYTLADLVAWVLALIDVIIPARRWNW